jgi:predicted nuclease of predicted toxin-antitoxin system
MQEVFTHDLDVSAIIAATNANFRSVFQIRAQDVSPKKLSSIIISCLKQFEEELAEGALVTTNEKQSRVRVLSIRR